MYRDILRGQDQNIKFVYLKGSYELLQERLAARSGHFFDPSLLQTQLDTLEEPDLHEAITIDIALTPEQIVAQVMQQLGVVSDVCQE